MPTPIQIGTWEWWANYGIAGLLIFIGVGVFLTLLGFALWITRDYWVAKKPHYEALWKAMAEKEAAQSRLYDTLASSEGTKNKILETLSSVQITHAEACHDTHHLVKDIHDKVVLGK